MVGGSGCAGAAVTRPRRLARPAAGCTDNELLAAFGCADVPSLPLAAFLAECAPDTPLGYAFELHRRVACASLADRPLLNEPALVKEYLRTTAVDPNQERTGALYLNARNRLLRVDPDIYRGTLDRAVVEPRELLRRALLARAASLILFHNHPSGDPTPSREDREFTRRLAAACEAIGVRLLDHIVVGAEGCVSFREAGLL
jgi:DNA repair protein RadC